MIRPRIILLILLILPGWLLKSHASEPVDYPSYALIIPVILRDENPPKVEKPPPKEEKPPPKEEKPPPKIWTGNVESGITGASGNSELFNFRAAGKVKRQTPGNVTTLNWLYRFAASRGVEQENRALLDGRSEWPFADSSWSCFVSNWTEYDKFKEFEVRLAAHAGIGYAWFDDETTLLKSRLGAGTSRELGSRQNAFIPEALVGLDFKHKISDRQKIICALEAFPDLKDLGQFRAISRASYEVLVDPVWNLTFKVGVLHRYDSSPEGKKPNDVEYFAVLMWSF